MGLRRRLIYAAILLLLLISFSTLGFIALGDIPDIERARHESETRA